MTKYFRPEFLARLTEITLAPISESNVVKILRNSNEKPDGQFRPTIYRFNGIRRSKEKLH